MASGYWWEIIFGTRGNDVIMGSDRNNIIIAKSGDDIIYSGAGRDYVLAGRGDDIVYGGTGDDRLLGQSGNDWLVGGSGNDVVLGNSGNDTIVYDIDTNKGDYDYYHGGSGFDTLYIKVTDTELSALGLNSQDIINYFSNSNANKFVDFSSLGFTLSAKHFEDIDVNVEITNQPPVVNDTAFNIDETLPAGTIVGTVIATDPDAGDILTYTIIDGDPNGLFSIDNNGEITTTEPLDHETIAQHILTVEVNDDDGLTDTAMVTVNVNDINDAPIAPPLHIFVTEDDTAPIDLLSGASDQDGDTLSVSNVMLVSGNSGLFPIENQLLYFGVATPGKPDARYYDYLQEGEEEVVVYSYDIEDGNGGVTSQTITITIAGINDAPFFGLVSSLITLEDSPPITINLLQDISDSESDPLTVQNFLTLSGIPASLVVNGSSLVADPSFYNHLSQGEIASVSYNYDISDGNGGILNVTRGFQVFGLNDAPTAIDLDNLNVNENEEEAIIGNLTVTDVDTNDSHTFDVDDPRFEVVNGQLKLKAGESLDHETAATIDVTVTATDSGDLEVDETFTINVLNDTDDDMGDTFIGGDGDDLILGGDLADIISGGNGDDILNGGGGNDTINGGNGNDTLIGGAGNDVLIGSNGDEVFVFEPGHGDDVIDDFDTASSSEVLDLSAFNLDSSQQQDLQDNHITNNGDGDAVINLTSYGGGTITVSNVDANNIDLSGAVNSDIIY